MPKTPNLGNCKKCGISVFGKRPDAQYCSDHCYNRRSTFPDKERHCKECGTVFPIVNLSDANRRYCSGACAKRATTKQVKQWTEDHPEAMREYNSNRVAKNPGAWIEKSKRGRAESLKLLGGKCIVCGVDIQFGCILILFPQLVMFHIDILEELATFEEIFTCLDFSAQTIITN